MPLGSFKTRVQHQLGEFPTFLIYAILEWTIIILLFVDGLLAFLSNELAKFFELRIPCLLCTRLDHIIVKRDSSFYYNESICEGHKKDLSSLTYCRIHKRLSDVRSMCQGCLVSYSKEKDSADSDKYKSLVGILHKDFDCFMEDERKLMMKQLKKDDHGDVIDAKSGVPRCSCCGESVNFTSSSKFIRTLSMNAPTPSPPVSWLGGGAPTEMPRSRFMEFNRLMSDTRPFAPEDDASHANHDHGRDDVKATMVPLLQDSTKEEDNRTPIVTKRNRFFGMPVNSAQASPRWANNDMRRLSGDVSTEPNEVDVDIFNRLKKQVRLDHKSLMALYMELDEERNASTIAANNAMAMITRLQAEKAAVQMEALQYQRMMEELAGFDNEALQLLREMLSKRDEDVQALESELEAYREKYGYIKTTGSEICEVHADEIFRDRKSQSISSFGEKSDYGADQDESEQPNEVPTENERRTSFDFEGERSYLLSLLSDLEKKVNTDEESSSSELGTINHEDEDKGKQNKATLTREVSMIKERLRVIEADSGFLKHAAMTLQRGDEGTRSLTEIAQHLQKLRHLAKSSSDEIDA